MGSNDATTAGTLPRMIRLSGPTVLLLRGVDHAEYIEPAWGAEEAKAVLSRGGPFYSMEGGTLYAARDIIENEDEGSPILARVLRDFYGA